MSINDLSVNTCRIGRVTNITPDGAFVDIGVPGHEGLLHRNVIPSCKDFQTGDMFYVVCTHVDKTNKRIGLRLK
jgi:ribosomal protein S1